MQAFDIESLKQFIRGKQEALREILEEIDQQEKDGAEKVSLEREGIDKAFTGMSGVTVDDITTVPGQGPYVTSVVTSVPSTQTMPSGWHFY